MLALIPSPSSSVIELGPLTLRAYGLMIALGVVAGVWLAQKRWEARGGDIDDVTSMAMWAVPAGLIGARFYHVVTDWRFDEGWLVPFKVWEGGLGIPGGMAAGIFAALWYIKRKGLNRAEVLDAFVPGLPLAQAIGRWGNWFNQELFGGPSNLPWAVEIKPQLAAEAGHPGVSTFHPTFLYESLWNLGLVVFLIWLDGKRVVKRGSLIAVYILGYLTARLWLETVRIDPATRIGGVRINIWMSVIGIVLSAAWLYFRGRVSDSDEADEISDDAGGGVEEVEMTPPADGAS